LWFVVHSDTNANRDLNTETDTNANSDRDADTDANEYADTNAHAQSRWQSGDEWWFRDGQSEWLDLPEW
jgi:hypothetical protein